MQKVIEILFHHRAQSEMEMVECKVTSIVGPYLLWEYET